MRYQRDTRYRSDYLLLVCYLDDSDAAISDVQTIAGYVSDEEGWYRFELAAEQVCADFQVDVIHAHEFERRHDCFRGWTVPRSIAFLHALGRAALGNVAFGVSRSIPKERYKRQKADLGFNPNLGAYAFAFGTISFALSQSDEFGTARQVQAEGIQYKVESGHRNNADIQRYLSGEVAHGNLHPSTSIEFVTKRSCRAIQLADLYAFYSRRRANKWRRTRGRVVFFPDALTMHLQPNLPHYTGVIDEPYTSATNLRTGETFHVNGLIKTL